MQYYGQPNQESGGIWKVLLATVGCVALGVSISGFLPNSLYASVEVSPIVAAPLRVDTLVETPSTFATASRSTALAAASDPEVYLSEDAGQVSHASPTAIGIVAAMSTVIGAAAMKFWGQRGQLSPVDAADVESGAATAPLEFRASAPWYSGSNVLNGQDFSRDSRAARMVLQAAAKGKGKGGGGGKGKIAGIIKLALPAGKATPAPPVGPALGQYGLNIVAFCKEYNAATEKEAADNMIIPVEITAFEDRSYTFVLKTPPASVLLKKAAGVPSGSATPNTVKVGNITRAQLEEIAKIKLPDLNTSDVTKAMKIVEGTAKQMGITIDA